MSISYLCSQTDSLHSIEATTDHVPVWPEKEGTPCEFMRSIDQISRYYVVKFVPFELLRTRDYGGGALC